MRVRDMFNKEYLAAEDLGDKDVTLTISRVVQEELRTQAGADTKWVVYFSEMEARHEKDPKQINKRLVLNYTNAKTIANVTSQKDCEDWPGHKITMYATTTRLGRDTVPCIRVRSK